MNSAHSAQQFIADVYGGAEWKLANESKLDATGTTEPQKTFSITERLVATAVSQGFKGDLNVLRAIASKSPGWPTAPAGS